MGLALKSVLRLIGIVSVSAAVYMNVGISNLSFFRQAGTTQDQPYNIAKILSTTGTSQWLLAATHG